MTNEKIHDSLKYWIIEQATQKKDSKGKSYYDRVYSGDTEPVDIRIRMKHFDYRPDVVLVRRDRKSIIEIALSEEWRAVVGELALLKAYRAASAIFIVYGWKDDTLEDIFSVMGEVLNFENWYYINLDEEDIGSLEKVKKVIGDALVEWDWI